MRVPTSTLRKSELDFCSTGDFPRLIQGWDRDEQFCHAIDSFNGLSWERRIKGHTSTDHEQSLCMSQNTITDELIKT